MALTSAPKKILAIKLRSLGDTVLMTAPLMELRKRFPQAKIHVAVLSCMGATSGRTSGRRPGLELRASPRSGRSRQGRCSPGSQAETRTLRLCRQLPREPFERDDLICDGRKAQIHPFPWPQDKNRYSTVTDSRQGHPQADHRKRHGRRPRARPDDSRRKDAKFVGASALNPPGPRNISANSAEAFPSWHWVSAQAAPPRAGRSNASRPLPWSGVGSPAPVAHSGCSDLVKRRWNMSFSKQWTTASVNP